ncbi:MAG: histidine kinase [Lewinellaceae bacterium]|nr:histidine kinase [Lewinellaceae bacterium]
MTARKQLDRLYNLLTRRVVYHSLFWMVLFAVMLWEAFQSGVNWRIGVSSELVSLFFYAVLVYVNLFYLIPNYLARKQFTYFSLVLASSAVLAPIKVLVLYLVLSGQPEFQSELVAKQGYVFMGNVLIMLLSTTLRVIMDWWRYQAEKQTLLTQSMQSELRFLRSQINPHFLFNTLNNLYALTLKKDNKAPEIVLKLSEIMRYMLYECNEKRVYLSKEIQYMQNYLDLERLRQPAGAEVSALVEGSISDQMIAPLLLVPFLENAFKHGLNHHLEGGGYVRVHIMVAGDDMEFQISNSKTNSFPRQEHPRSGGIGLVNVRQRLQILYPKQHELHTEDSPNDYTVTLSLNLKG